MRRIFDRIPLFWKYLMMSLLIFVAFYLSFYFFTNRILVILKEALLIEVPLGIFKNDFVWFFIWAALLSMLLLMLMYVDLRYFLSRLNNHFKYAIARKK